MPEELRAAIVLFASLLDERQRRLFAGLESLKCGWGGARRIAQLLGIDPSTVATGRRQLVEPSSAGWSWRRARTTSCPWRWRREQPPTVGRAPAASFPERRETVAGGVVRRSSPSTCGCRFRRCARTAGPLRSER